MAVIQYETLQRPKLKWPPVAPTEKPPIFIWDNGETYARWEMLMEHPPVIHADFPPFEVSICKDDKGGFWPKLGRDDIDGV